MALVNDQWRAIEDQNISGFSSRVRTPNDMTYF